MKIPDKRICILGSQWFDDTRNDMITWLRGQDKDNTIILSPHGGGLPPFFADWLCIEEHFPFASYWASNDPQEIEDRNRRILDFSTRVVMIVGKLDVGLRDFLLLARAKKVPVTVLGHTEEELLSYAETEKKGIRVQRSTEPLPKPTSRRRRRRRRVPTKRTPGS